MATTSAHAIKVLEAQIGEDPALAEAVQFMAEDIDGPEDPFSSPPPGVRQAARTVNRGRTAQRREAADASALDTRDVVGLLSAVNDRKGVDRRRRRGQLLAWRSGSLSLHPAWQFDRRRGETRDGLPLVLTALAEVTSDPQAADALMRAPRADLGGRSLADLFAAGQVQTTVRLLRASTDQS